ncbi:glycosyltransferase [Membranihabitans maritimus]|uniref:glycosyltransferase n=1 Tax=Membranihabitans maritimus TaxID=2904244 RepID=UPI001F19EF89|nr:glycosyltransferase [Membranihabitans maritimus]
MLLFLAAVASVYLIMQLFLFYSWKRSADINIAAEDLPHVTVSIVIPVRNEETNILDCIQALLRQKFPAEDYEIIVINDHSTDHTRKKVETVPKVKIIDLPEGVFGKKEALIRGINEANGEIILTTDGDCIVGENWVVSMVGTLIGKSVDLVTGPIVLTRQNQNRFIEYYQQLEQASLNVLTSGGIKSKLMYSSNGANMGFLKSFYKQVQPYEDNVDIPSGDDVFFIQKGKLEEGRITFVKSRDAIAYTPALTSFESFLNQRLRWGGKAKAYRHLGTKFYLGTFLTFLFIFLIFLLLSIGLQDARSVFLYLIISKLLADYMVIRSGMRWVKQKYVWTDIVKASYFQILYSYIIMYRLIVGMNYKWKGRKG